MKPPSASAPSYRSLVALEKSGSTTRVLNLAAIAQAHGKTPEYAQNPFFAAPMLNRALVVKHRLRADDVRLDGGRKGTVTKVIIPFDPTDLGSGGASFLVGQVGWMDLLQELCDGVPAYVHDRSVLECLDETASFDPFLLREQLRRRSLRPADCYFAIGVADREAMRQFVEREIEGLIQVAYAGREMAAGSSAKLVEILLASDVDERLEPLRLVLRLEGEDYRAGIFAWKGFLYYKWAAEGLLGVLRPVIVEMSRLELSDRGNPEVNAFLESARARLQKLIQQRLMEVAQALGVYDEAFGRLTMHGEAAPFREFLLNSPTRFLALGERIGAINHVVTYWRYRFSPGRELRAPAEEIIDLLDDFEAGLAQTSRMELAA